MKLTIGREPLLQACRLAARVLPPRGIGLTAMHFLLRAGPESCTLHAAGPDASFLQELQAQAEEPGQTLLPALAVLAILRQATADTLRVEASSGQLLLRGPGSRFLLAV